MAKGFNSIAEINAASGLTIWELGHNFTDYDDAASPPDCDAVIDGTAFLLQRLGTNTPTKLAAPQARYSDQGGVRVNVADGFLYRGAHADWSAAGSTPVAYLIHFRVDATDATEQTIYSGLSGTGSEGWRLTVKGSGTNAGLRLYVMGVTSSVPAGSSDVCDGKEHTVLVVIDDANNRARMVSKWGTVTMTSGFTYSESGPLICTIGPTWTGDTWSKTTSYFWQYKGKHADIYNNAADVWARINQDVIARSMGAGAFAENENAEETGTLADATGGAVDSFEAEWDDYGFTFTGGDTLAVPAAAGGFALAVAPVAFAGGATLAAPTAKGVVTKSAWVRTRHVDAAVSRIVGQLLGNYNPATFEAIAQNVELAAPSAAGGFELGS